MKGEMPPTFRSAAVVRKVEEISEEPRSEGWQSWRKETRESKEARGM